MTNVRVLNPHSSLPNDFPATLRKLADDVEAGKVISAVVGAVVGDDFEFFWPSNLVDSLTLTTLMQAIVLDKFKGC